MDAATLGISKNDPEYYRLDVEYAMRVTYSGEFLHAAPWSAGSQGVANVSHGCVGMATENAAWLFDITKRGDVVDRHRAHDEPGTATPTGTSASTSTRSAPPPDPLAPPRPEPRVVRRPSPLPGVHRAPGSITGTRCG
jgi:hypothetical protein